MLDGCVVNVNRPVAEAPPAPSKQQQAKADLNFTADGVSGRLRLVEPFERIEVKGGPEVTIRVGSGQSVVVSGDSEEVSQITTEIKDKTLLIGTQPQGPEFRSGQAQVAVTVPRLGGLSILGSSDVEVQGVTSPQFEVSLQGSGSLKVAGTSERLALKSLGSGDVDLSQLAAQQVTVDLSGSGKAQVKALDSLVATVKGSGNIVYQGNPKHVKKSISGSGEITGS